MESIVKKLFLIGTATLAIAVTLTSASTQAFECDPKDEGKTCTSDLENSDTKVFGMNSTFSFSVAKNTFALNGVTDGNITLTDFNTTKSDTNGNSSIGVGVVSNQPFQIQLTATNSDGSLEGANGKIAPVTGGPLEDLPANKSSWGVWQLDRNHADNAGYIGIDANGPTTDGTSGLKSIVAYKSGDGANFLPAFNTGKDDTANFVQVPFGARVDTSTAPGTYSTTVKVTVIDNVD